MAVEFQQMSASTGGANDPFRAPKTARGQSRPAWGLHRGKAYRSTPPPSSMTERLRRLW